MKFCNGCNNMYYIKIDEDKTLLYYCRNCGNIDTDLEQNFKITNTNIVDKNNSYNNFVNDYTRYDNTLPRVKELTCINEQCESHNPDNKKDKNILLIRVNEDEMKYINVCGVCNTIWDSSIK